MNKQSRMTAIVLTAAAALTLAACGGGKDDSGDEISGVGTGSPTVPATPSAAPPSGAPTFAFPSDTKVVVDPDKTGDATKDAVLRDHGYALTAMQEGYVQGVDGPVFQQFWTGKAGATYATDFAKYKKQGLTVTGTDHFYDRKVTSANGQSAVVTFCEDQSRAYDKEKSTGKVLQGAPSLNDFRAHRMAMTKSSNGVWQVSDSTWVKGAQECKTAA